MPDGIPFSEVFHALCIIFSRPILHYQRLAIIRWPGLRVDFSMSLFFFILFIQFAPARKFSLAALLYLFFTTYIHIYNICMFFFFFFFVISVHSKWWRQKRRSVRLKVGNLCKLHRNVLGCKPGNIQAM